MLQRCRNANGHHPAAFFSNGAAKAPLERCSGAARHSGEHGRQPDAAPARLGRRSDATWAPLGRVSPNAWGAGSCNRKAARTQEAHMARTQTRSTSTQGKQKGHGMAAMCGRESRTTSRARHLGARASLVAWAPLARRSGLPARRFGHTGGGCRSTACTSSVCSVAPPCRRGAGSFCTSLLLAKSAEMFFITSWSMRSEILRASPVGGDTGAGAGAGESPD